MIRPPPLKLKYDNRFPLPIPSARRPKVKESFFASLYHANWRNIIIAVAGLNALRYAFASFNAYKDAEVDDFEHAPKLATVSIALCVMYAISCAIEIYGVIGVLLKRLPLVRVYTFLAFVSAVIVTAASVLNAASFFLNAEDLMYECVALAITGHTSAKSQFQGRHWPGSIYSLGLRQAQKQCIAAWTHESWTQVINVFIFGFVPSLIYYLFVYTYYRQTTDPSHSAYLLSRRHANSRAGESRDNGGGYSRVPNAADVPYAGTPGGQSNNREQQRNGHSQHHNGGPTSARLRAGRGNAAGTTMTTAAAATSRGLNRPHRPPALLELEPPVFTPRRGVLLQSGSPLAYTLSPGPPTFGVNIRGVSRLAGVNLTCSGGSLGSARYDKFV